MALQLIGRIDLYERQPKETDPAWEAFRRYRDLGGERSCAKVAEALGKSTTLIERWSSRWRWVERAAAWDAERDRARREAQLQEVADMGQRQGRQAQAIITALLAPATALLRKINTDPDYPGRLVEDDPRAALSLVVRCASVFPQVANAERLARGLPTSIEQVHTLDSRPEDLAVAIRRDPEAATLATDLFARIYGAE